MAFFQSKSLWVQQFAEGVAVLQFDPSGKAVRLSHELLDELHAALDRVASHAGFRLLLLRSLKSGSFCQGPDVPQWRSMKAPNDFTRWAERGQSVWSRLRSLSIPSVAWVQGACLGAGLELALACDHIITLDRPDTSLGFTELDVGLLPSWGGLEGLLARVGLEQAFPLALAGRRVGAREAATLGLADHCVPDGEPQYEEILALVRKRTSWRPRHRSWRQRVLERFGWSRRMLFRAMERIHRQRLPEDLPAPAEVLEVLRTFRDDGPRAGRERARDALVRLAQSPAFDNLLRLHELRERAHVRSSRSSKKHSIVGILGSSPLGLHLLVETVKRGNQVILRETDETRLGFAIIRIVQMLNREISEGRITSQDSRTFLSRIRSTITWKNFNEVDLAVDARESATDLKTVLAELEENVSRESLIVTTSPAGSLASATLNCRHPERVLGAHVFGSPGQSPVAEVRHAPIARNAVKQVREWISGLGWTPIAVGDQPGLLLDRLWVPAWNEVVLLIREGAAPDRLDQALARFGFGRSLLEFLDQLGLEQVGELVDSVRDQLQDRIPIDPFWTEVLSRPWRGRATGKGFYRYGRGRPQPNHLLMNWLQQEGPITGERMPVMAPAEQRRFLQDRVILLMVNEAFRCLEENRVDRVEDLDLALMLTDWAPHRGGPIRYAERRGFGEIISSLRGLERYGTRYRPCERLLQQAGPSQGPQDVNA